MEIAQLAFESYAQSIPQALDAINGSASLAELSAIIIKPNLINASPPPVTTPAECCKAIIEYIRRYSKAEIVIAEGCGDASLETGEVFDVLGYSSLAQEYNIKLIDLNHQPLRRVQNRRGRVFPEMYLPDIAFTHYIISVPVLKAHSLAQLTETLKNMMGFPPPEHYSGSYGSWKKAQFHNNMQQSIIDLNLHIAPDLTVMDCSVGMAEYHLGGPHCNPPVGKIIAGYNPWLVDRQACQLLGLDWNTIEHIAAGDQKTQERETI